jgi:hypothetical protein
MAAKWIVFNRSQNRQELQAVYPSQSDADAAIVRYKRKRPSGSQGDALASVQVES